MRCKTDGLLIRFVDEEESLFTLAGEFRERKLAIFEAKRSRDNTGDTDRYSSQYVME